MVTPLLRELAGPDLPFHWGEGPWSLVEHNARRMMNAWVAVCRQAVQTGSSEELHAARDDYQAVLLGHLKILDGYLLLLSRFESERPAEFAERFAHLREQLQTHHDALFPRWQTLDDLEAILLERVSLPNDQLKALAATHSPPQAWYDETADLTTPE